MRRSALILLLSLLVPAPLWGQGMKSGNDLAAVPPADTARYWLNLERSAEGLALSGQLPDELTMRLISTYAAAGFGADGVRSSLETVEGAAPPPGLMPAAMAIIDTLAEIEEGRAELTGVAVRVTGRVEAPEAAGRLTRTLGEKLPPGIRFTTAFRVPEPDLVAAPTLAPTQCAETMTRIAADRGIRFGSGSAEIGEESTAALTSIVELFARCPRAEIEVAGFTDNRGDPDRNLDLSQARAEAVMQNLLELGIPLARLRARGFGEAEPVADNETEAGRARNRRIEFRAVE